MKAIAGVSAVVFLATGVSAQTVTRGFGSVVFPGGTSATTPGVARNFGSVVFPGGSSAPPPVHFSPGVIGVPRTYSRPAVPVPATGQNFHRPPANNNRYNRPTSMVYAYPYPVFVGGYDTSMVASEPLPPPPPAQPMQMMTYPTESARPVMIQVPPEYPSSRQPMSAYQAPPPEEPAPASERFLLAFKDHTVYSAVAYWFDGDTLHYFTSGSVHNQVSVSLIDRDLTTRLNRELGIDFHMPAAK